MNIAENCNIWDSTQVSKNNIEDKACLKRPHMTQSHIFCMAALN